jgi:hypothetical protein
LRLAIWMMIALILGLPCTGAADTPAQMVTASAAVLTSSPVYNSNSTSDFSYTLFTRSPSQT